MGERAIAEVKSIMRELSLIKSVKLTSLISLVLIGHGYIQIPRIYFSDSDSDSRNLLSTKGEQQKNAVKEQYHGYHQCASTTTQLTRIIILHIQQEVIVSCKGELHYQRYKITPGPDPPTPLVIDWEASAKSRKVLIWKPQTWGIATLIGRIGAVGTRTCNPIF